MKGEFKIKIKNKEHATVVLTRLHALGCSGFSSTGFLEDVGDLVSIFYVYSNLDLGWDRGADDTRPEYRLITTDDLFEMKQWPSREVETVFDIMLITATSAEDVRIGIDTYTEAERIIKEDLPAGRYRIARITEVTE